jgi:hypothetical protein
LLSLRGPNVLFYPFEKGYSDGSTQISNGA